MNLIKIIYFKLITFIKIYLMLGVSVNLNVEEDQVKKEYKEIDL